MRVLMIITNLDFGGAQLSFARLSKLLFEFVDLKLVVFNRDNIAPLEFHGELVDLNVNAGANFILKGINFFRRAQRLRKIKKEFQPHVSISFLEGADFVNILSAGKEKIFLYLHGSKTHDKNLRGINRFISRKIFIPLLYSRADKILVVNDRLRLEMISDYNLRNVGFQVQPNMYDVDELKKLSEEPIPDDLAFIFKTYPTGCISGRIAPEKGIERFMRIFPDARNRIEGFKIIIVGDGQYRNEVMAACKSSQIKYCDGPPYHKDADVFFVGYQQNPYKFLGRSSLLLLPSLNEGMPNTIVEAMCLSVPVVAADCPYGPRELLGLSDKWIGSWPEFAEYGVLVPVLKGTGSEANAWSEAIARLLSDKEMYSRYSKKGHEKSLDFSTAKQRETWRALLNARR